MKLVKVDIKNTFSKQIHNQKHNKEMGNMLIKQASRRELGTEGTASWYKGLAENW